jgi:hypothetical protein
VQWETPVSSQSATGDLGRVELRPCTELGDFYNWRYQAYDPLSFQVDYSDLAYNPVEPNYPVFHDGGGGPDGEPNGKYDTDPTERFSCVGAPPSPDLNHDGDLGEEDREDFPLATYSAMPDVVYSRPATHALEQQDVFGGDWPQRIATPAQADLYWDVRESVRLYGAALAGVPRLEGMVLASVRDHFQSAPDKPHLRQALEGWDAAGAWVQINPSPTYLLEVDPHLDPEGLPANPPNTPPAEWSDFSYCVPESVDDGLYQLAAIWQMADRAHRRRLYLPLAIKGY